MALEKWEVPTTITALRGFLGFTNYYAAYVEGYAELLACLQELLKVGRVEGKKGSKVPVKFGPQHHEAFQLVKQRLLGKLELNSLKPDQPFVLRVDASGRAVGGVLEQFVEDREGMPTLEQMDTMERKPVAFYSRKLLNGQRRWAPRKVETYAIVQALRKWQSWIGNNPVLVLTDHKTLESWYKEDLGTPSGQTGRRARWHELFSQFDM